MPSSSHLSQLHTLRPPHDEGIGGHGGGQGTAWGKADRVFREQCPVEVLLQEQEVGPPGRGPGLGERIHRDLLMGLREETGPYWTDNATHLKFP